MPGWWSIGRQQGSPRQMLLARFLIPLQPAMILFRRVRRNLQGKTMSELEAKQLLESAQRFIQKQRAEREREAEPAYHREGSHVTVGVPRPLSPDFVPSSESHLLVK